jgi:heme oxygenase
MTVAPGAISSHARVHDYAHSPRVRRLHARIGSAHRRAEGMAFSRSLLEGRAEPLQLAALLRALLPAYALLEAEGPALAAALGAAEIPWEALARSVALRHDIARLAAAGLPPTPPSTAAALWLEQLRSLARQAPHRFLAHVYVRYGGDLSGGQQLAARANAILAGRGIASLEFWQFARPCQDLRQSLHAAFEQLELSEGEEEELLQEAESAFHATQRLLAELTA